MPDIRRISEDLGEKLPIMGDVRDLNFILGRILGYDVSSCFDPDIINNPSGERIIRERFAQRENRSIFEESGIDPSRDIYDPVTGAPVQTPSSLPDRKALDDVVFDAIGLTREERDEVYRAVCQLVKNRLVRARSVRNA